jgi:DNA-binding PadR family transcriptional regulator
MNQPDFRTEAEEAEWISENREQLGEEFAQAMREGRTVRLTPEGRENLAARIDAIQAKAIQIRLAPEDLQLARDLAAKRGLPYQTYITSLLHDALERESGR